MRSFVPIVILLLLGRISHCQTMEKRMIDNVEVEVHRNYFNNGSIQKEWTQTTYQMHGYVKEFYENGQARSYAEYRLDKPYKVCSQWYSSGKVKQEIRADSSGNLVRLDYYESGQLKLKGRVSESLAFIGEQQGFFENGNLEYSMNYDLDSKAIGKYLSFFENGSKRIEGVFRDHELILLDQWDANGKQLITKGKGIVELRDTSGAPVKSESYLDGLREGLCSYYKSGKLISAATYTKGVLNGESISYYTNGRPREILLFKNGELVKERRNLPMYEQAVLVKTLSVFPDERRNEQNALVVPKTVPELLNKQEVLNALHFSADLYKNYDHELKIRETYRFTLAADGRVKEFTRSTGSGLTSEEAFAECFRKMKFDLKNQQEEGIRNQLWVRFEFSLKER